MCTLPITLPIRTATVRSHVLARSIACRRQHFHDYFVTHLPSSSLHPDAGHSAGPHHKLPRNKSTPSNPGDTTKAPAEAPHTVGISRDLTVVRIPLRSARHHYGLSVSRGARPYNEDAHQAGTIDIPAFARKKPISLTQSTKGGWAGTSADSASGDPQVFYFGVFDGHGGVECSDFLREQLHGYVEDGARQFELESSLKGSPDLRSSSSMGKRVGQIKSGEQLAKLGKDALDSIKTEKVEGAEPASHTGPHSKDQPEQAKLDQRPPIQSSPSVKQSDSKSRAEELEKSLVTSWRELVGGYFRRFKPEYFSVSAGGQGRRLGQDDGRARQPQRASSPKDDGNCIGMETVLSYAFLKADYDFVSAQAVKQDEDAVLADLPLNNGDVLGRPSEKPIGGPKRFKGGSTCSIALISTPTPMPFWHPASPSTLIVSHVGDTRILLCNTATGLAIPMTTNHHPSDPGEATRLRRYAATFVTDSFGEERVSGLANTRAFGDMQSKRIGVSAEPEIRRLELAPAEYSFVVLMSDGVSGMLSDQEIVDIVKEARTPEQGARDVVSFATEIAADADNATALVVRLGGWERRGEGGLGSLGTKEMRDFKREDAMNPRRRQ